MTYNRKVSFYEKFTSEYIKHNYLHEDWDYGFNIVWEILLYQIDSRKSQNRSHICVTFERQSKIGLNLHGYFKMPDGE